MSYLTYLTYMILFDLVIYNLTGLAANFLMENSMETASLESVKMLWRAWLERARPRIVGLLSCRQLC